MIKEIKLNDTQWLFIEVLNDSAVLVELHEENEGGDTLHNSITLLIHDNDFI